MKGIVFFAGSRATRIRSSLSQALPCALWTGPYRHYPFRSGRLTSTSHSAPGANFGPFRPPSGTIPFTQIAADLIATILFTPFGLSRVLQLPSPYITPYGHYPFRSGPLTPASHSASGANFGPSAPSALLSPLSLSLRYRLQTDRYYPFQDSLAFCNYLDLTSLLMATSPFAQARLPQPRTQLPEQTSALRLLPPSNRHSPLRSEQNRSYRPDRNYLLHSDSSAHTTGQPFSQILRPCLLHLPNPFIGLSGPIATIPLAQTG